MSDALDEHHDGTNGTGELRPLHAAGGCLLAVFLILVFGMLTTVIGGSEVGALAATFLAFFAATAVVAGRAGQGVRQVLARGSLNRRGVLATVLLGLGVLLFNGAATARLYAYDTFGYVEQVEALMQGVIDSVGTVGLIVLVGFIGPLAEEVFFRGLILRALLSRWSPAASIWVSSLLFAVFHFHPIHALTALILGLLCGWAMVKTDSVLAPFVIHAVNNTVASTFSFERGAEAFPLWFLPGAAIALAAGMALLLRETWGGDADVALHRGSGDDVQSAPGGSEEGQRFPRLTPTDPSTPGT